DSEQAGRITLIALRVVEHALEQDSIDLTMRFVVEVVRVGRELASDKRVDIEISADWPYRLDTRWAGSQLHEEARQENLSARLQQRLFHDALQLADVSGPRVGPKPLEGF